MNLDEGYPYFENEHGSEKLEGILAFIMKTSKIGVPLKEQVNADFVCRRGLLRNLSINKHCHTFITFYAVRHRGVIFLCEDKGFGEAPDKLRRAMYCSIKFESVMTFPQDNIFTATKKEETKKVIHACLEKKSAEQIRIYYAAEIDCLGFRGEPIEIKTISKPLETGWDKSRSLAWYMQCFLSNVKTIVVGEREKTCLRTK
uniref:Decapping nuclease n=1 Tax=Caenorhabditis japonica TaxID=281687 RepID=A0A8R1I944_CAEJA